MLMEPCNIKPVDFFRRIYHLPYSFLLDSCGLGRYSFAGAEPFLVIKAQDDRVEITEGSKISITSDNFFSLLNSIMNDFKLTRKPSPIPFQSGAVGYLGYDLKNQTEKLPRKGLTEPIVPDCILGFYDTIFAYDHKTGKGYILSSGLPEKEGIKRRLRSKERIGQFIEKIGAKGTENLTPSPLPSPPMVEGWVKGISGVNSTSNFTKEGYIDAIRRIQDYIAAGDIYQANLSQRLNMGFTGDPLALYEIIRKINPVPFGAFLNYGDFQIMSNSPERLLKIHNGIAETSPIKGTRPRGRGHKEDRNLIKELKTNAKELSEHIMIVDLERNDLGRFCDLGSIKVKPLQKICTYPTLHHMVSTVKGKVRDGMETADCIKAFFPGGSVTGAPKIRAMEIIDELEPTSRGIYTGAIGYIDFSGNMDLSMTIRTAILKDKKLYLHVGGGIVADSNPEEEYDETLLKARVFLKAMEVSKKQAEAEVKVNNIK